MLILSLRHIFIDECMHIVVISNRFIHKIVHKDDFVTET